MVSTVILNGPVPDPARIRYHCRLRASELVLSCMVGAGGPGQLYYRFPLGLALGRSLLWGWVAGGGLVALLQWVLLRHQITRAGWWMVVSVVGMTIGTGLSLVVSQYVLQLAGLTAAFASVGAAVGISVGTAQWLLPRLRFRRSGWWVLASTVGYSLGLLAAVNAPVAIPVRQALIFGPEFGGLVGVISSAVSGITMFWLLRRLVSTNEGTLGSNSG